MSRSRKKIRAENGAIQIREQPKSTLAYFLSGGDDILPEGYKPLSKNEEIVKCANIIADMVSSMTIMLMQNGENGDIRIKNELSRKIDINPCSYMNRKNFIYKIVKDMILDGNSIVWPDMDGMYIRNLIPLKRKACAFQETESGYYILYQGKRIEPEEVLHFVLVPDEDEPFRGIGYKAAIIDTVKTLVQANATKKGFLKSKWKPSLIVSINTDVEDMMDKDAREKIIDSYVGTTEAGEPWVIPAGEMDVKSVQPLSLNDLAVQESIELDKKAIAAAFGVPKFMVGVGDFNKEEYNNFVSTKIMFIATIVQQQLSEKLLISPNLYFKCNPKTLMQYDLNEHFNLVKGMVSGGMLNRNEGRCEFDYSPVDNPGMNDYIVLENFIPVEKVGEQKKLKEKEGKENDKGTKTD